VREAQPEELLLPEPPAPLFPPLLLALSDWREEPVLQLLLLTEAGALAACAALAERGAEAQLLTELLTELLLTPL